MTREIDREHHDVPHLTLPVHDRATLGYRGYMLRTSCDVCSTDKIVVGSFQGLVRIYLPRPPEYSPDHVILEKDMGAPVLQVAVGRFLQ